MLSLFSKFLFSDWWCWIICAIKCVSQAQNHSTGFQKESPHIGGGGGRWAGLCSLIFLWQTLCNWLWGNWQWFVFWLVKGPGTGAHVCVPAGQRQELQTPVEMCRGEPCLLSPAPASHEHNQPQWLHATRVPLQIQVEHKCGVEQLNVLGGGAHFFIQVVAASSS